MHISDLRSDLFSSELYGPGTHTHTPRPTTPPGRAAVQVCGWRARLQFDIRTTIVPLPCRLYSRSSVAGTSCREISSLKTGRSFPCSSHVLKSFMFSTYLA